MTGLILQSKLQKKYVDVYNDLVQIDSTHKLSRYVLRTSVPISIDCLGRTTILGLQRFSTESQSHVLRGMKALGINKSGSTLMSDGASCFANAAKEFNMQQIRCLNHLRNSQLQARAGLVGDGNQFMKDTNNLMCSLYESEDHLKKAFESARKVFYSRCKEVHSQFRIYSENGLLFLDISSF